MTFLPIVWRELRLASRKPSTYWLRSIAAFAILMIGTWFFIMSREMASREMASFLFAVLTCGAVLFALLSGPRSTADCISEEKREGTLGLLFLTDLKGYDVVLGKLVAGSLSSFYTVVAIVPMLAIPLLLGGGITWAEFGRMALVTLNALFLSLTIGVWASSLCRSAQRASGLCSLALILFVAALPALGALAATLAKAPTVNRLYLASSVGFSYYLAYDAQYRLNKEWFWISLGVVQAVSWAGILVASWVTPRSWQDKRASLGGRAWQQRWQDWNYGNSGSRQAFRRVALERNPIFWLAGRMRIKAVGIWIFLLTLTAVWVWCWWKFGREWLNEGVYVPTAWLVNLALRYWYAGETTRFMVDQRKSGAFELLLSTPLQVEDLLRGQWLALQRQFLGPVVAVLVVEVLFMVSSVKTAGPDDEHFFWFVIWSGGMLMLLADLAALFTVGLWQGLNTANPLRALGATLGRILVLPWVLYGMVLLAMAVAQMATRGFQSSPTWAFFVGLWFVLGIGIDMFFGIRAYNQLKNQFRHAAQQQYLASNTFWGRWISRPPRLGNTVATTTLGAKPS